jgi:hypothetical protein
LSFPNPPKPSPLGFHRAHLSLRDKTETQNESTKICQSNSQFCPKREHGRKRSLRIGDGFRPVSGVCLKETYKPPTPLNCFQGQAVPSDGRDAIDPACGNGV